MVRSRNWLGVWLDTTQRRGTEEDLKQVREQLSALVQASPTGIVILDADRKCLLWDPAAECIFGRQADEVIGHTLPTIGPKQSDEHRRLCERVMKGETFSDLHERAETNCDETPVGLRAVVSVVAATGFGASSQRDYSDIEVDDSQKYLNQMRCVSMPGAATTEVSGVRLTNPPGTTCGSLHRSRLHHVQTTAFRYPKSSGGKGSAAAQRG
jgi:PAS domain S-box-containing protein